MKINQKENRNKKENRKETKFTLFVLDTKGLKNKYGYKSKLIIKLRNSI